MSTPISYEHQAICSFSFLRDLFSGVFRPLYDLLGTQDTTLFKCGRQMALGYGSGNGERTNGSAVAVVRGASVGFEVPVIYPHGWEGLAMIA